ncbi:nitrate reductase cytochrome c-type subunit [Thiothrix nivea]|uniref:Periplasmic nitrate reductase, electron transfer subunit n=1 Tax=Thiothrix nivea (strain ATCC 35100 / DSM 5205 / JP2) TaxID=870187 RepID=A0A656HBZ7_THINJ|nr:nitrate reductase cytochrome c-type subunit [Thiothrix nivea]EIJ33863.1 Nitrate reductase cytochrome c-type subunit (NapB) [Thiothrix nivea DSM 5205]
MKKTFILNIVLSLALGGMAANLYAEDAAKPADSAAAPAEEAKPADTATAPAEEAKPAETTTASTGGDTSASAAPTDVAEFTGQIGEIGGAAPDADSAAPEIKHRLDGAALDRNYFQQPPLIPHKVDEYRITVNNNKCMSCHSWDKYKESGATKISQTHFKDRDGKDHSTLAARRYFCTQCHVPQVDAAPLIENEFKPVDELNK